MMRGMDEGNDIRGIDNELEKQKAMGCILGAFIGDALGSYCEFSKVVLTNEEMKECEKMEGGGVFCLGAG